MARFWTRNKKADGRFALLLWAPNCDELTKETSNWARMLKTGRDLHAHRLIGEVRREGIREALLANSDRHAIACFLGHGIDHALIGEPFTAINGKPALSPIYDEALFEEGPHSLFAFCCDSGNQLGPAFGEKCQGAFLGYQGKLLFFVSNEACRKKWVEILQSALDTMVEDRAIKFVHLSLLHRLYEDAYRYYEDGPGSNSEERFGMQMSLIAQREALVFFEGRHSS